MITHEVSRYLAIRPDILESALRAAGVLSPVQKVIEELKTIYVKVSETKQLMKAELNPEQVAFLERKTVADFGLTHRQEEGLKGLTVLEIANLTKEELMDRGVSEAAARKISLWFKQKSVTQAYLKPIESNK